MSLFHCFMILHDIPRTTESGRQRNIMMMSTLQVETIEKSVGKCHRSKCQYHITHVMHCAL